MASGGWRVGKAPPGGRAAEKRNSRSARPSRSLLLPPGIVVKLVRQRHASQSAQFVAGWSIRSQRNCMSEEQTGGSGFKGGDRRAFSADRARRQAQPEDAERRPETPTPPSTPESSPIEVDQEEYAEPEGTGLTARPVR